MAISGLPTLIVGVGGTGLRVLQRVKERLLETYYGEVPPHIKLLELDTALQSPSDHFCDVRLNEEASHAYGSGGYAVQELQLIQTTPTFTMDHVFDEAEKGKERRWSWVEVNRLKNLLPPAGRSILDGAGAYRPVGRVAFFLNYPQVQQRLVQAMQEVIQPQIDFIQVVQQDSSAEKDVNTAASKRNVFIVGSMAGGTGSGAILDVAAMLRSMVQTNAAFNNIVLIGIVALPQFFTGVQDAIGRRVPNSYAGLREADRFIRGHTSESPYSMVVGNGQTLQIQNSLFDLCYLVDMQDYFGMQIAEKADHGPIAVIADMVTAHTDVRLGLRLNATNINVPSNYHLPPGNQFQSEGGYYLYQSRRFYSSMNSHTVIFPREDVARALSLRFLIDLIDNHIIKRKSVSSDRDLTVNDDPLSIDVLVEFLGKDTPTQEEKDRAKLSTQAGDIDLGVFVRTFIRESTNPSRKFNSEMSSVLTWLIEDAPKRQQVEKVITSSTDEIIAPVEDKGDMNHYVNRVDRWLKKYLGPLNDPNIPLGDRSGGEWEKAFGDLVIEFRPTMEARVDDLVMRILNQREDLVVPGTDNKISLLRANRAAYALALLRMLKERVRVFEEQASASFGKISLTQARKDLSEQEAVVKNHKGGWFKSNPGPNYLNALKEVAHNEQQRLLRNLVLQMAQQFGGDIVQEGRQKSVLDVAIQELEEWVKTLVQVRERIATEQTRHEGRRREKYAIRSRTYVTDPARFPDAQKIEDGLYTRYRPLIWRTLLGPDPSGGGGGGLFWDYREGGNGYFDYAIMTKNKDFKLIPTRPNEVSNHPMLGVGKGVEGITRAWTDGAFRLFAEQVRSDKTARVAHFIMQLFSNAGQVGFVSAVLEKHSRVLTRMNSIQPNLQQEEHYLAVDPKSDDDKVTGFYSWFNTSNWQKTNQQFLQSESDVACTYLTLYHGLEVDHISGFGECEPAYRNVNTAAGCLHLFPEEQLAADYEARIPLLGIPEWMQVKRLHPEVVVCLNDDERVRNFALALVSELIKLDVTDHDQVEYFITLPESTLYKQPLRLTNTETIPHYDLMRDTDRTAARILQAFQTFMLRGHAIGVQYGEHNKIDYAAIRPLFETWLKDHHNNPSGERLDDLVKSWRSQTDIPGLWPLFKAESQDPRFRDLGIVLYLELDGWRKSRRQF